MKLKDLRKKGALVTGALVKKEITWEHFDQETGEALKDTFSIFVIKRMSAASYDRMSSAFTRGDMSSLAAIIAESVRLGDEGEEKISYAEACILEPSLALLFATAAGEVAKEAKERREEAAKNSRPPMSSGTSSSSPASEAEA